MTIDIVREAMLGLACLTLIAATIWDVALRTIPNTVCSGLAIFALGLRGLDRDIPTALIAGAVVFALAFVCWMRGWLGGGDVKLLGAVAFLVPPTGVPGLLAYITMAGGGLAVCYLLLSLVVPAPRGQPPGHIILRLVRMERWRISRRRSLPYAFAITAGAFFTLLNG
jgi:prepilin peptidase CpaA